MNAAKIKEFNRLCKLFAEKQTEITEAMSDLEDILAEANYALKDTVDNGITAQRLSIIDAEYSKHKFESTEVQAFINEMCGMLLSGVDESILSKLEVTSLEMSMMYNAYDISKDGTVSICGPVTMFFIDKSSCRKFSIDIPVKDAVCTDILHWKNSKSGLYVVKACSTKYSHRKDICKVFDQSKVSEAVVKYLNGEFDDELDCTVNMMRILNNFEIFDDFNYSIRAKQINRLLNGDIGYNGSYSDDCICGAIDDSNVYGSGEK